MFLGIYRNLEIVLKIVSCVYSFRTLFYLKRNTVSCRFHSFSNEQLFWQTQGKICKIAMVIKKMRSSKLSKRVIRTYIYLCCCILRPWGSSMRAVLSVESEQILSVLLTVVCVGQLPCCHLSCEVPLKQQYIDSNIVWCTIQISTDCRDRGKLQTSKPFRI